MAFSSVVGNKVELIMFGCETVDAQTVKGFEKTGEGFRLLVYAKGKTFVSHSGTSARTKGGNSTTTTVRSDRAFWLDKRVKKDSMSADVENISGATLHITGPQKGVQVTYLHTNSDTVWKQDSLCVCGGGHDWQPQPRLRLWRSWAALNFRLKSKKSRDKEEVCGDPAAPQTVSLKTIQQLVSNKAQSGPSAQL